jgi:hypothetical protein
LHEALKVKNNFREEEKIALMCLLWPILVILVLQKPKNPKIQIKQQLFANCFVND